MPISIQSVIGIRAPAPRCMPGFLYLLHSSPSTWLMLPPAKTSPLITWASRVLKQEVSMAIPMIKNSLFDFISNQFDRQKYDNLT